jgi:hypothetical protein
MGGVGRFSGKSLSSVPSEKDRQKGKDNLCLFDYARADGNSLQYEYSLVDQLERELDLA